MGHSKEPGHTPDSRQARVQSRLAEMDYRSWRKAAAQVVRNRDDLAWGIMHENAWIRLYVEGLSPEEAADWARTWHNSLSFSERLPPR
jgi:hypothetical protein